MVVFVLSHWSNSDMKSDMSLSHYDKSLPCDCTSPSEMVFTRSTRTRFHFPFSAEVYGTLDKEAQGLLATLAKKLTADRLHETFVTVGPVSKQVVVEYGAADTRK